MEDKDKDKDKDNTKKQINIRYNDIVEIHTNNNLVISSTHFTSNNPLNNIMNNLNLTPQNNMYTYYPTAKSQGAIQLIIKDKYNHNSKDYIQYGNVINIQTTEIETKNNNYLTSPSNTQQLIFNYSYYEKLDTNNKLQSWVICNNYQQQQSDNNTENTFLLANMQTMKFIQIKNHILTFTDQRKLATPFKFKQVKQQTTAMIK